MNVLMSILVGLFFAISPNPSDRTWRDKTEQYEIQAELVVFNGEIAVVRKSDGQLLAFPVEELSDQDRKFLESEEAAQVYQNEALQTWTFRNGRKVNAYLVSHVDKEIVIQRRRNRLYVNDRPFENLPEVYQKILPAVIGHFEDIELEDRNALERWLIRNAGARPRKYRAEGVILAFENGDEFAFPYFLFAEGDRKFLEAGREEYHHPETSEYERMNHALYMQAMAREFQRDREFNQQVQLIQTQLLGVASGVTDLWEVALVPPGGTIFQARTVIVPARNSMQAAQMAAQQWPGMVIGPANRVNRRR